MIGHRERGATPGSHGSARPTTRMGATLTEVLMSLLILAVGVISVLTLFPLSILQAVSAHNHTQAKILSFDTADLLRSTQLLVNVNSPAPATVFRGYWQSQTGYTEGQIVVPTLKPGSVLPSPNRWFVCITSGTSGIIEPNWNVSGATTDGSTEWAALAAFQLNPTSPVLPGNPSEPFYSTNGYVVDPLGWNVFQQEQSLEDHNGGFNGFLEFGNRTDTNTGLGSTLFVGGSSYNDSANFPLLRLNGGLSSEFAAMVFTTLPDSWEEIIESPPANFSSTSVDFPPTIDLSDVELILNQLNAQLTAGGPGTSLQDLPPRIVLTTADGLLSETRFLDVTAGVVGQMVRWSSADPLPAAFVARDIGSARIEVFDRRYSWFITVRKPLLEPVVDVDGDGNPEPPDVNGNSALDRGAANSVEMKLAVVFRRGFSPEDEHVYDANFSNPAVDIDSDGTEDSTQHGLAPIRRDWVKITWIRGTHPEPFIKPGTFLFDARGIAWYRIAQVLDFDETATPPFAVLGLDRTVEFVTPGDGSGAPEPASPPGRAILFKRVVDVYDL